jgi:Superinfection immunity protein
MGKKTMESFAYGIGNLVGFQLIVGFMFGIYLAPSIVAVVRGHHRWPWIGLLNFAAGWTVAGWIASGVVSDGNTPASDNAYRQHCTRDCLAAAA